MKSTIEQLDEFRFLFSFTVRGIIDHLREDQPEPDQIEVTLVYLREVLDELTDRIIDENHKREVAQHDET